MLPNRWNGDGAYVLQKSTHGFCVTLLLLASSEWDSTLHSSPIGSPDPRTRGHGDGDGTEYRAVLAKYFRCLTTAIHWKKRFMANI